MLIREWIGASDLLETLVYISLSAYMFCLLHTVYRYRGLLGVLKKLQIAQPDFSQLMWTVMYISLELFSEYAEYAILVILPSFFCLLLVSD